MKRCNVIQLCRLLFSLTATTVLYACGQKPYPTSLYVADSLTAVQPDSALRLLQGLENDMVGEPEATRMYYRLLLIKAQDKAYVTHTSDSNIVEVVHYYEGKRDERHLAEAYYYAGRVYSDLGNTLQASDYFWKVLSNIRRQRTDHPIKATVYSQLGTLYAYRSMYQEALEMYKASLQTDIANKDSTGMVYTLRDIANMYRELNRPDSVLPYYRQARQIAKSLHRTDLWNMMQSQLTSIYTEMQAYDSARVTLHDALRHVEVPNRNGIYSIAAFFYQTTGEIDSARHYYRLLLDCGSIYAKEKAYHALLAEQVRQASDPQLQALFSGWQHCTDSLRASDWEADRLRTYSDHRYLEGARENARLKDLAYRRLLVNWISGVILAGVFLAFGLTWQHLRKVKRQKDEQQRKFRQIEIEKQRRIDILESYQLQKEKLENKLKDTAKAEDSLETEKQQQKLELINHILEQDRIKTQSETEAQKLLLHSPLYTELKQRARSARGIACIRLEEWDTLRVLFESAYPGFFEHLYFLCNPNENELHVSMLTRLTFPPADIARLLELKPGSISSIRVRLYQKATGKKGRAEMWDKIVMSL